MKTSGLTLRAPITKRYWLGIVFACMIPICVGIYFFSLLISESDPPFDLFVLLPSALIFTFGTPVVAVLSGQKVRRQQPLKFATIFSLALKRATIVQVFFYAAEVFAFLVSSFMSSPRFGSSNALDTLGLWMGISAFGLGYHIVLWAFVTFPLTLICALIFRAVSMTNKAVEGGAG